MFESDLYKKYNVWLRLLLQSILLKSRSAQITFSFLSLAELYCKHFFHLSRSILYALFYIWTTTTTPFVWYFVQGYKHRRTYIAAQAPLEETVNDFWRMIMEKKSNIIVMLSGTDENDQVGLRTVFYCIRKYVPEKWWLGDGFEVSALQKPEVFPLNSQKRASRSSLPCNHQGRIRSYCLLWLDNNKVCCKSSTSLMHFDYQGFIFNNSQQVRKY